MSKSSRVCLCAIVKSPSEYGKGWPWTPKIFTWARHARPFYALRLGHP